MENNEVINVSEVKNVSATMPATFAQKYTMAGILVKSGLLPTALNTPEKVATCLQWAHELGLTPMAGLNNIAVVNGKPTLSADIMAALARKSPEYGGIKWTCKDTKKAECIVTRKGPGYTEEYTGSFTIEEAAAAGLVNKDNWKKFPARMLAKRALSFALRDAFPDMLAGVYQPEELEEQSDNAEPVQLNEYTPQPQEEKKIKSLAEEAQQQNYDSLGDIY